MEAGRGQVASTTERFHSMQYKVRLGTIDSGKEYEKKMLTLFALRSAVEDEENIWIAANAPHVGVFGDTVLHYGYITFLVQLKHRQNAKPVTEEAFKEEEGDFSLTKYYEDMAGLKKSLDSVTDKSEFVRYLNTFDKLYFILFTNRDVNDYDFLEESNKQVLQFLNTSDKGRILKTVTHKLSGIVNLSTAGSFKNIYLFANQISVKHTDHQIQEKIRNIICKFNLAQTNVKTVAEKFTKYISDWAECKFGSNYCLSKTEILSKLSEILLEQYQLNLGKEMFDTGADTQIAIWNQLMDSNTLTFVNYDQSVIKFLIKYISNEILKYCGENISSWLNNLSTFAQYAFYENHKSLKSQMLKIVGNRGKITAEDIFKCLWLTGKLPALLVIKKKQQYTDILKILKLCDYCYKVILINKSEEEVYPQKCEDPVKQIFSLKDLNEIDRNTLLKLTVALQGRSSAPLQHFVDQSFYHLIKCNDIINILLGNFNIGNDLEPLPDYFIERKISKVLIKLDVPEQVKGEKFVIEGEYEISSKQNLNIIKYEDFDFNIVEKRRLTRTDKDFAQEPKNDIEETVHHLKVYDYDKNHFEWIASYGSTKNIRQFVVEFFEPHFQNIILEDSRLTLLSGAPGMGKSMLLNDIARHVSETKWVLKIELNSYVEYCRIHKVNILTMHHLEHVENMFNFFYDQSVPTAPLSHRVFEKLRSSKDVVFLLDAFDEISILYKEEVTDMIKSLYNEGFHICLTTRPNMVSYLEEQFNTFSISLNPFSQYDEQLVLTNFFISRNEDMHLNLRQRRCVTEFTESLLCATRKSLSDADATFTEIPLQCALLAEVFNTNFREFILSGSVYTFNESFDPLYLYRSFINSKMNILRHKFGSPSDEMLIFLNNLQSFLALKLIFPLHKDIITYVGTLLKCHYTNESEGVALLQKGGIVTIDKNVSVSFVHRTLAEYIVAEWLADNFNNPDQNLREYVKILMNERFSSDYRFLFTMFDRIVAENRPLYLAIINGKTDNLISTLDYSSECSDYLSSTDKCKRSVLHLAALYGYRYPPLFKNTSQTEEAQSFLDSRAHDTDSMLDVIESFSSGMVTSMELDVFGYNPLDYALASFSLTVANKLYTKLDILTVNININLNCKEDYIGYCALQNYKGLFKVLLVYFATKDLFMIRANGNTFVKSYYHHVFTGFDFQKDKILNYLNKFKFKTILELILTQGPKVFPWFNDHNFSLHISVIFDSRTDVCRLIQKGVDVNKRDHDYNTPLHYTMLHKHTEIFNTLLQNGANVNQHNLEKNTPLHFAVIAHDYSSKQDRNFFNNLKIPFGTETSSSDKMIIELVSKGATVNFQNSDGNTPLHLALLHKNEYLAELLLSKSSDAKLVNKNGENYLHLAAFHGFNKIVLKLLSVGADIYGQNNSGDTPLHRAIINNELEIANLLISMDADPNITNNYGRNCLHVVSYYGYNNIVSEILPIIKDIDQQDKESCTAIQLALQQNKLDTVKLLISKGADANGQISCGRTSLHVASCEGHTELASEILPFIKSINQQDHEGFTPLQLAVQQNKSDIVKLLVSKGADQNILNKYGRNCLHEASCVGNMDIAADILPLIQDINQQDNKGFTSLQFAMQENKPDIVKLLISNGADPNIRNDSGKNSLHEASCWGDVDIAADIIPLIQDINQRDNEGFTSLQLAVQENKSNTVKLLISNGADPNIRNNSGENCLHEASCVGNTDIASDILPLIQDINQQDNTGHTSLQFAVQENKLDIVKLLISNGADPNIRNQSGENCLYEATCWGHLDIAADILPLIEDINQRDYEGYTSLQLAVQNNKLDIAKLVISNGADPNIRNNSKKTSLHEASYWGHIEIAADILPLIQDINQQDDDGCTSLHLAVQENKWNIAKLLISKGANPNIRNKWGENCLHKLSYGGYADIVADILPLIQDINQQNDDGFTSLHLAVKANKPDIVKLLISNGADPNIHSYYLKNNCLHAAICSGFVDIVADVLPLIRNINLPNRGCDTSLLLAVWLNKSNIARLLISNSADPNIGNYSGRNCLHQASYLGRVNIAADILPLILDINQHDNDGFTSLQLAVQKNNSNIVKFLISNGADPNIQNYSGRNCLHEACYWGHVNIADDMLPLILDINQQDNDGFTSLQLAVQENKSDIVKLLISNGADPNIQNKSGENCLHEASYWGHIGISADILPLIRDINQQDNKGFTSLQLAVRFNEESDIAKLLISNGADPNIRNSYGRNCLHDASCGEHVDIAVDILPLIQDINQQDNEGFTSLQLAVQNNKSDIAKLLIYKDANQNLQNVSVGSSLHEATCERFFSMLQVFNKNGSQ